MISTLLAKAVAASVAAQAVDLENLRAQHELLNTVVDKLGIAAIVALLAFFLNRAFERYKAVLGMDTQLATEQIDSTRKVWSLLYDLQQQIDDLGARLKGAMSTDDVTECQALVREVESSARVLKVQMSQDKWTLGLVQHAHCCRYARTLRSLMLAYLYRDEERATAALSCLARYRQQMKAFKMTSDVIADGKGVRPIQRR